MGKDSENLTQTDKNLRAEDRLHLGKTQKNLVDAERALNILYNSRTYALLDNPDSGLQLMSDSYILNDLLRELEA